jgi:Rho guanine nucleotide exchange factor 12
MIAFCSVGRAMELQKARHPKHFSTASSVSLDPQDPAKLRQSVLANEGTDTGYLPANSMSSVASGTAVSQEGGKENDTGKPVL